MSQIGAENSKMVVHPLW